MLDHYQAEFLKASSGVMKSYVVPGGQVCRCGKKYLFARFLKMRFGGEISSQSRCHEVSASV